MLGTPALFATAYGNVGSSIYYALGVTAVFALGLTPLVFVIAGLIFAATAATYAEGTVRYPEAGGSSSFARHAFNELVSFGAAWAQMLVYVATVAISAFFVPHYLVGLLGAAAGEPLGHRRRRDRRSSSWSAINIVGVQRGGEPERRSSRSSTSRPRSCSSCSASSSSSARDRSRQRPARRRADLGPVLHRDPDRDARLHRASRPSRTWRRRRATRRATSRTRTSWSRSPSSPSTSRCRSIALSALPVFEHATAST